MATITLSTPAGPFTVLASDSTVLAAGFTSDEEAVLARVHPDLRNAGDADLDLIEKAVAAYFDGDLTAVDAVATWQRTGGAFQAHAWDVMRRIRPGEPVTYTEFAELAGRPTAIRAAAAACARNAAALFVPCHRVVRTDGGLGGYRWGLGIKRLLLAHERQMTKSGS
jgi:methylated-DNA-[protein]-cysteine S-methyltransferase